MVGIRLHNNTIFLLVFIFCSPLFSQESKENSDYKLALNLYSDGMYDLAVEQFGNFIATYPTTSQAIDARFYLGLTQMKLKRYDEARLTFQNFALSYVDHPKAPEAWINVAEAFAAVNNLREAASAYERIKVFHPKSTLVPEALLNAGRIYRSLNERELARKVLRTIIQDFPTSKSSLPARLELGQMYADDGQTELAEAEARRVSESDAPPAVKASALFSLGRIQAMSSLFDEAETTLKTVRSTYKSSPVATAAAYELAQLAMSKHNYSSAIELLKIVVDNDEAEDSLRAAAMLTIGIAYTRHREFTQARRAFEKVVSQFSKSRYASTAGLEAGKAAYMNEKYSDALTLLKPVLSAGEPSMKRNALWYAARSAVQLQRFNEASGYYTLYLSAYRDASDAPEIMLAFGDMYRINLRDYRKAISLYDDIVQQFPQSPQAVNALWNVAVCQESLGENDLALRTYNDMLTFYPANDFADSIYQRIRYLQHHIIKNRDAGMEKLARLIGEVLTDKSQSKLAFELGEIYYNDMKDYPSAIKQYSTAIDAGLEGEQRMTALFHRARAYHLQSELDSAYAPNALSGYDLFLRQYPKSESAEDAAFFLFEIRSAQASGAEVIPLAKEFLNTHPSSSHGDIVLFTLAQSAADIQAYPDAIAALYNLLKNFPDSPIIPKAHYLLGENFLMSEKQDSAIASWKSVLAFHQPAHVTVLAALRISDAYLLNKKYNDAVSVLKKIILEVPYTSSAEQALQRLITAYRANGNDEEALDLLLQQQERLASSRDRNGDDDGDLLLSLAQTYERKGEKQKAVMYYHRLLSTNRTGSNASKAFFSLGTLARTQGKTTIASSYFKQAAALGGTGSASKEIADLLFQTEQYAEASKQYKQLAQEADSVAEREYYWSRIVVATFRSSRLSEAQQIAAEFEKTFGKRKEYLGEFEFERGSYFYRKQDYASAKSSFEKLTDDYEKTRFGPWGYFYLAKILEVNNKLDEAAKRYDAILKKYPASEAIPRVLLSLGNMHFNAERYETALKYYQQITESPERAGDILSYAMNNAIEAYESTKLYDAALSMARNFIERFPNDESVTDKKIKIGTLYTKLGYYDQAILQFQHVLDETGSALEAELRYCIGEAYFYKGDHQQAILEFLKVPYLISNQGKINWTATSLYMAGQSYEKMSKFDEAIGMYQQIIDRSGIDATFKSAAKKEIERVKSIMKSNGR